MSKEISWQEKIPRPFDDCVDTGDEEDCIPSGNSESLPKLDGVHVFTYINSDVSSFSHVSKGNISEDLKNRLFKGHSRVPHTLNRTKRASKSQHSELKDRLCRENPWEVMLIMAGVSLESTRRYHEEVLCIIKVHKNGLVSSYPGWSEEEPEDCDDSRIFASDKGLNETREQGSRLTTFSFTSPLGSVYEYTIEPVGGLSYDDGVERMITKQNCRFQEKDELRRDFIRRKLEPFVYTMNKNESWNYQANIEIVSATGFEESNILLCAPFGSSMMIRYQIYAKKTKSTTDGVHDDVLSKGITNRVHRHSLKKYSWGLIIISFFVVNMIFAVISMFTIGDAEGTFSQYLLVATIPLWFIAKFILLGDGLLFHFNHMIPIKYNLNGTERSCGMEQSLVLELNVYYKQNFGITSLGGYGTIALPLQTGESDFIVPTYVPVSTSQTNETICQMHRYYLGTCLDEVRPFEPVPICNAHAGLARRSKIKMFSRGGLATDTSGIIRVRVSVMKNYFEKICKDNPNATIGEMSFENRVRRRETVDEVLARVRKNKRERMTRLHDALHEENIMTKALRKRIENRQSREETFSKRVVDETHILGLTASDGLDG
eukprot:CAMPEP_0171371884 /NCGR_PEP_ID=MMETSP0879-20121228/8925_1 /TAXON_ID=67004 /ORGANISM="Thalassiosira weissflogii, Strain CCMP1336" /LENGTH=601 /DNA_ID=CAMNT_0011880549 /DNA_START=281 /DNA_END=2086 /DNA_ORIENTATION=+